jgi:crotonobetainyl-CoA:carnitine CoA-transferase CaiB-like acyl-CoA transferase
MTPAEPPAAPGPMAGIKVVELSHELTAWAGKLMADLGATVVVVEPPGGSRQRTYGPFLDDEPGPERSLWWWHYNTSKLGVVLDWSQEPDASRLHDVVAGADVLLAAEPIDRSEWAGANDGLITVSIEADETDTDLTILAAGGPVWMCGYDDHSLPPVRGGGNQGFHTASHWAMIATLVALLHREVTGAGQHVLVSPHAAANVTTEIGSYGWLAAGIEVTRQTGRHAWWQRTLPTQFRCADGRYVNAGVGARKGAEFQAFVDWLDDLGIGDEFEGRPFLGMGAEREFIRAADLEDPVVQEIARSVREAQLFAASRASAYDFFVTAQQRGLTAGIVYAPEELFDDPHFVARGWPTPVEHPELDATYTYPGAPYRFTETPWRISARAPQLGEHQSVVEHGWP